MEDYSFANLVNIVKNLRNWYTRLVGTSLV